MEQKPRPAAKKTAPVKKAEPITIFKPRVKSRSFILSVIMTSVKMMILLMLVVGVGGTGLVAGLAKAWIETTPPLDVSKFDDQVQTSFIYDANGSLLTDFKGAENRIYAPINEIPRILQDSFIAIEDVRFRQHNGVDLKRIAGAFVSNLTNSFSQGGSTISQQLIKITMLSSEQTYKRKLQEAYLAMQLETRLSKDQILEEYLNSVFLGNSNYGVKVAAQDYFGKELSQLTLRECATLAGMNRNPSRYNPRSNYYTRGKPEVTDVRTNYVLKVMLDENFITQDQYNQATSEQLKVLKQSPLIATELFGHPFYVEYAIYDVVTHMLMKYQMEDTASNRSAMERKLRSGGYHIYTSLDPEAQTTAAKAVANYKNYPRMRDNAHRIYKAPIGGGNFVEVIQPQAAAAIVEYATGRIIAIVGGRQPPTQRKQLNRAYMNKMPIGSSIKPISVYGPMLDLGNSPASPAYNLPIPIAGWVSEKGFPQNYGGGGYSGVETVRTAIQKSHNTAAAQVLMMYVGVERSVAYLLNLGISKANINQNGAGLALGSSGINMIELAGAFGAIANKGLYVQPIAFRRVVTSDGEIFIDGAQSQVRRQVFKPSTAYMLVDLLKGSVSPGGTGQAANFNNYNIGGKTGTNSDAVGVTFAGFTPYYSGAVWIGHDMYKPLVSSATGGTYAAGLWANIMAALHKQNNLKNKPIIADTPESLGLVKGSSCLVSNMEPTSACRADANGYTPVTDWWLTGTVPTIPCNMHRTMRLCTYTKLAPGKNCPSASYGVLYIPDGHPLRMGSPTDIRQYFAGATATSTAGLATCNGNHRADAGKANSSKSSNPRAAATGYWDENDNYITPRPAKTPKPTKTPKPPKTPKPTKTPRN